MKHFDIYTDCAGSENEFGISFVVFEGEEDEKIYKFKTNTESLNKEFGVDNKVSNTSIAECYAIFKALLFLKDEKEFSAKIYTDNDHAFMLLNKLCRIKKRQKNFGHLLSCIVGRCKQLNPHPNSFRRNIQVCHINGHIGIYGNEIANIAAQHAKNRKEIDVSKRGYKFNDFEIYKSENLFVIQKFKKLS